MTKDNDANGANGAANGEGAAPVPATTRPQAPTPAPAPAARPFLREGQEGGATRASMEGYRGLPIQSGAKLKATTKVINAFNGYLVNALGRPADEMTEADVATLGEILAAVERLEPSKRAYN